MQIRKLIKRVILPAVILVVLAGSGAAYGESGCHRGDNGGGGSGTTPAVDRP